METSLYRNEAAFAWQRSQTANSSPADPSKVGNVHALAAFSRTDLRVLENTSIS
jgi:hypothetical protein